MKEIYCGVLALMRKRSALLRSVEGIFDRYGVIVGRGEIFCDFVVVCVVVCVDEKVWIDLIPADEILS